MKDITEFDFRNVQLVLFDFDGVFTNNKVIVAEDGAESVVCSRLDGIGLRLLDQVEVIIF